MATRYYFSSTTASPVALQTPDAGWADTTTGTVAATPRKIVTTKSNSALTGETISAIGNGTACSAGTIGRYLLRQWVSDQIGVFNFTSTTVSFIMKCLVSSTTLVCKLNVSIRLLHPDTTFTSLLSVTAADYDTAYPATAATRIGNAVALASVSSQNNDRLVVEMGINATTLVASCRNVTMTDGDVSATADYALTSGLTTSLDPWIEFSGTLPAPSTYNAKGQFLQFM